MKAMVKDVNIRGCERKEGKKGDYLLVRFEDETGKPDSLVDKELSRQEYYKRDTVGDLYISIEQGKYTNIRIIDFKMHQ